MLNIFVMQKKISSIHNTNGERELSDKFKHASSPENFEKKTKKI